MSEDFSLPGVVPAIPGEAEHVDHHSDLDGRAESPPVVEQPLPEAVVNAVESEASSTTGGEKEAIEEKESSGELSTAEPVKKEQLKTSEEIGGSAIPSLPVKFAEAVPAVDSEQRG